VPDDGTRGLETERGRVFVLKLLLSGAGGFTGMHIRPTAGLLNYDVIPLQSNLCDLEAVKAEVARIRPDYVLHLAGVSFVGHRDYRGIYEVNLFGSINLLSALSEIKSLKCVLLASSANIYGNCARSPIEESTIPAPVSHYAISKLAMEHIAKTYQEQLPIVIARPFNYTGPGQSLNFVIPKLVDHFSRRASSIELGNLEVEREFNDVGMVCSAYLGMLKHGKFGEAYNICSGKPYTLHHVIDTLQRITGHSIQVRINPAFVRANEVHSLCGSPSKLQTLLTEHGAELVNPSLESTLTRMLIAHGDSSSVQ
jgi:GDP-6-deoxy-D-talose 4-dehydrogenase